MPRNGYERNSFYSEDFKITSTSERAKLVQKRINELKLQEQINQQQNEASHPETVTESGEIEIDKPTSVKKRGGGGSGGVLFAPK